MGVDSEARGNAIEAGSTSPTLRANAGSSIAYIDVSNGLSE